VDASTDMMILIDLDMYMLVGLMMGECLGPHRLQSGCSN
jgi:hypothetical protein